MKTTATLVLFWGNKDTYSNWHPAAFVINGVRYENVEKYMMAEKARTFGDVEAEQAIMNTADPKVIKAIGRTVAGYDEATWAARRENVVFQACLAKFSQNPPLRHELLATGDRTLVEASPFDQIWGIGLGPDNPLALDLTKWHGQNLLGKALMRVREALRQEDAGQSDDRSDLFC